MLKVNLNVEIMDWFILSDGDEKSYPIAQMLYDCSSSFQSAELTTQTNAIDLALLLLWNFSSKAAI